MELLIVNRKIRQMLETLNIQVHDTLLEPTVLQWRWLDFPLAL